MKSGAQAIARDETMGAWRSPRQHCSCQGPSDTTESFTPMLLIGATLGSLWAQLVGLLPTLTSSPSPGSYARRDGRRHGGEHSRPAHGSSVGVRTVRRLCHRLAAASRDGRRDDGVRGLGSLHEAELRRKGLGWELTLDGRPMTGE